MFYKVWLRHSQPIGSVIAMLLSQIQHELRFLSRVPSRNLVRVFFVFLLTLLASGSWQSVFAATCGDYVTHSGVGHARFDQSTSAVNGAGDLANLPSQGPVAPLAAPCSCKGPQCQQAPPIPAPLAPPTVDFSGSDSWASLASLNRYSWGRSAGLVICDDDSPVEGFPSLLDRPPRSCS